MNTSAALVVAGIATDFREGVARAEAALEDGKAAAALDELVRISNAH